MFPPKKVTKPLTLYHKKRERKPNVKNWLNNSSLIGKYGTHKPFYKRHAFQEEGTSGITNCNRKQDIKKLNLSIMSFFKGRFEFQ